ncbi:MAG: hypothetical protein OET18_08400 [Desulfobacterales bacterium]|nr:hypothetical protein [Desulfobacterales bacterium]
MENKLYIHFYEPVFSWHHFLTKPAKWIIKGGTGSEACHVSGSYDFAGQKEFIKQSTFDKGFHSVHHKEHFKKRFSKIYSYEVKVDIDFPKLHNHVKSRLGDEYHPPKSIYSAIDRIAYLNKLWRKVFKIKLNDDKFDFCDKAWLLVLQAQGYLLHIKDVNSLNPEELKKEIAHLCYSPMVTWNKTHYVNNIFKK